MIHNVTVSGRALTKACSINIWQTVTSDTFEHCLSSLVLQRAFCRGVKQYQ